MHHSPAINGYYFDVLAFISLVMFLPPIQRLKRRGYIPLPSQVLALGFTNPFSTIMGIYVTIVLYCTGAILSYTFYADFALETIWLIGKGSFNNVG